MSAQNYGGGITATDLPRRLARALRDAGVTVGFGVPGGGPNLDVVGALLDEDVDFVLAHAETSAAIMAATHGLFTRAPAPVIVTRGPGAASVINGAAQATLDRYPLTVITDTVPASARGRVAHQRIDQRALFDPVTKASATLAADIGDRQMQQSLSIPTQWPFGALHLDYDVAGATDTDLPTTRLEAAPGELASPDKLRAAKELIDASSRPLVIVGMEAAVTAGVPEAVAGFGAPVLTTYQAIGVVDSEGEVNAGLFTNGALERPVLEAADLIITVGLDLVEPIPRPWTLPTPVLRLSLVRQEDAYLPADVDVVGDLSESVRVLLEPAAASDRWPPGWAVEHRERARNLIRSAEGSDTLGPLSLVAAVSSAISSAIDGAASAAGVAGVAGVEGVTTTVDAGAHFLAIMPLWPVRRPLGLLISNGLATMGFAVPAAIGAATARPGHPVVALTGDGGMAMTLGELETIARRGLPITVVVFNDAALSLIRIKQTVSHGGDLAVAYQPTNFAEIASGSGLPGFVVKSVEELHSALASGWDGPRLLDVRIDPSSYPALIAATRG